MKMNFKVPTVDREALKTGMWGNTWRNWGLIMLAFLALYAFEAGYFTGLLFASKGIRGDEFKSITSEYFGPFYTGMQNAVFAPTGETLQFNRPDGCTVGELSKPIGDTGVSVQESTGLATCSDGSRWAVFPWVKATNGAGKLEGCSVETSSSTQTINSLNPAFPTEGEESPAATCEKVCQNFVPVQGSLCQDG